MKFLPSAGFLPTSFLSMQLGVMWENRYPEFDAIVARRAAPPESPAQRVSGGSEEIPARVQFSAKPETERWREFLSCVSLTKKMHLVTVAPQRFSAFAAPSYTKLGTHRLLVTV